MAKEPIAFASSEPRLQELMRRIAAGHQEALAEMYDRTAPLLHGMVRRIVRDPDVAEEVTHDVFLQVWRRAHSYDPARGAPSTWMFTLARSRAIDRLRATARFRKSEEPLEAAGDLESGEPGPDEGWDIAVRRRRVREAIASLSPAQQEVILIAFYQGLSHSEIADRIGQPLGTVKTRIRLAMIRLREALEPTRAKE